MPTLYGDAVLIALDRFSHVESLMAPDRVCLASCQGSLPDLGGRAGFILHWAGTSLPWFLWPLHLIFTAGRCLVELTEPASVTAFAKAADQDFTVKYYSFPRTLLPSVIAHLDAGRWNDALEVAHQDATYAELEFFGDCPGPPGEWWMVFYRGNRECPADLMRCFLSIDGLEDA